MKTRCVSFLCLALVLLVQGQDNPDFISIDCGAPNDYIDNLLNISYKTDAGFVDSGQVMQVPSNFIYNNMQQLKNLRSFPNGTRNCYTLRPRQGMNKKYLIRATFLYGYYDNKGMAPEFDLHVDTNYWHEVKSPNYVWSEIIYVAPREYIQVCLLNKGTGTPFISALELRLLDSMTYHIDSGALVIKWRENVGSSVTYRHPQDDYDRIWAAKEYDGMTSITNTTVFDLTSGNDAYDVPAEVLMSAQQVNTRKTSWPSNPNEAWYIVLHFAEIQVLQPGQVREFTVYMEDGSTPPTLRPRYSTPATVVSLPITGRTRINYDFYNTSQSTLPPIMNAQEIFNIINLPISQTALNDVNAMVNIKISYAIVRDSWQGDPCAPPDYLWKGLNCTYGSPPRIISLNLSSSMLKGGVSDSFSNLTALVTLNLSNNNLSGVIPHALIKKMADGTLKLSVDGNPHLPQVYVSENKKKWIVPVISSFFLFVDAREPNEGTLEMIKKPFKYNEVLRITENFKVVIGEGGFGKVYLGTLDDGSKVAVKLLGQSSRQDVTTIATTTNSNRGSTRTLRLSKNRHFTFTEVTKITDNFTTVIGEGGFGKVYFGKLDDGTEVAVKMLSQSSKQGYKEFHTEAQLLMVVHHRNLVSLIGHCEEFENMALIYEFLSNGNVQQHLSAKNPNVLSWSQRLQIAIDAAQGLEYLHNGCKPPIVHRDLKTPNILLNESMQAKIADFGLSKAFVTEHDSHITTRPSGTPGYLDPEFHTSGNLSRKSDVYSFGVVLFELITGLPAIIRSPEGSTHIVHWVTPLIERRDIQSIVDPRLNGQFSINSAWKAVEIAMSCVPTTAVQRPDINRVLWELKECLTAEIDSGRSQRMGYSKRKREPFEMTIIDGDIAPSAR
ncbi:probable LRR receptor-like serine/threonine-protein kinase At1g05700 [Syzygium oleosum]|uniref:probable LRR receptor-like serine/threonine-protein kinase At1g05700 n=1 Tax=Syzygium oleosum TaxID=219896 RepID=UPI0024B93C83|nr:probable LRR receptor-like serine/threonine-protein kinase At1g05700 [Syzygium oleosum]